VIQPPSSRFAQPGSFPQRFGGTPFDQQFAPPPQFNNGPPSQFIPPPQPFQQDFRIQTQQSIPPASFVDPTQNVPKPAIETGESTTVAPVNSTKAAGKIKYT
jgi:hypothetical protein